MPSKAAIALLWKGMPNCDLSLFHRSVGDMRATEYWAPFGNSQGGSTGSY